MALKIGVIIGSNRPTRLGDKVAQWFMNQVKDTPGTTFEIIDLKEVNLPYLDEPKLPSQGDYQHEHTKKWGTLLAQYDGFVLVTPEYNHGYSAPLKNALDTAYAEWARKPVAFVGYGSLGASAAIEQLVNVTAQLHMVPQPATAIKFIDAWALVNEDGSLNEANRRGSDVPKLLENLLWWTQTLKSARG